MRFAIALLFGVGLILSSLPAHSMADADLIVKSGHSGGIFSGAFIRSGTLFVTGGIGGELIVWNANTGRLVRTLSSKRGATLSLASSQDGSRFVSTHSSGSIALWDVATGKEIKEYKGHMGNAVSAVLLNEDKLVVSGGSDGFLHFWDHDAGKSVANLRAHEGGITSVGVSKNVGLLISGGLDGIIKLWDIKTRDQLRQLIIKSPIQSVAISASGELAAAGSEDGYVTIWDVGQLDRFVRFKAHSKEVTSMIFDSDAKHLITASSDTYIKGWTVEDQKNVSSKKMDWQVFALIKDDDHRKVLSVGLDKTPFLWSRSGADLTALPVEQIGSGLNLIKATASSDSAIFVGTWSGDIFSFSTKSSVVKRLSGHTDWISVLALDSLGKKLISGSADKSLRLWDVDNATTIHKFVGHEGTVLTASMTPDARRAISGGQDKLARVWDLNTGLPVRTLTGHTHKVRSSAISADGSMAVTGGAIGPWNSVSAEDVVGGSIVVDNSLRDDGSLRLWNLDDGHLIRIFESQGATVGYALVWQKGALSIDWNGGLHGWILDESKPKVSTKLPSPVGALGVDSRGNIALVASESLYICNLRRATGCTQLPSKQEAISSVSIDSSGQFILAGGSDGRARILRLSDGSEVATLIPFRDGSWVVVDKDGRFDTGDLEAIPHLHWVMSDDPFTPVPIEAFMRDYYEPRLLARLLSGETFKPVRTLTALNHTQPEVKIVSVVPDDLDPTLVRVTVSATGTTKLYRSAVGTKGSRVDVRSTAVHDLRVFRDGQLVGYADGRLADVSGALFTKTFNVHLSHAQLGKEVVFSAYAFNDDRVKSETVRATFSAPAVRISAAAAKPRAYVISMGVNRHDNPAWNLGYAANDARAMGQRVSTDLRKAGQHADVVQLVLASDGSSQHATKAALRAVLARLAGRPVAPEDDLALQGVAGAEQLLKAKPDDLVLISFAGHGFTDDAGQFYLVPQDTGPGSGKQITAALKAHSVGSDELSLWLRDVDAGDMTMIVDACQSAASVQTEGFKPGPMGSRGLGQLSFDKGMRILAASQSDEFALEDQRLQHGLLTFSLINDGLDAFNADFEPQDKKIFLDEWLKYGVKRVPTLADEVKAGTVKVVGRGPERAAVRVNVTASAGKPAATARPAQQPALFDFARKRRPVALSVP